MIGDHGPTVMSEVNETALDPPIRLQSTVRKHHGVIHTVGQLLRLLFKIRGDLSQRTFLGFYEFRIGLSSIGIW